MTFYFSKITHYVANAIARKSFILGGSEELLPCITILIENAINSSRLFAVYSYSLKSSTSRDGLTIESGAPVVLKKL